MPSGLCQPTRQCMGQLRLTSTPGPFAHWASHGSPCPVHVISDTVIYWSAWYWDWPAALWSNHQRMIPETINLNCTCSIEAWLKTRSCRYVCVCAEITFWSYLLLLHSHMMPWMFCEHLLYILLHVQRVFYRLHVVNAIVREATGTVYDTGGCIHTGVNSFATYMYCILIHGR